jgi:hypothetical protein
LIIYLVSGSVTGKRKMIIVFLLLFLVSNGYSLSIDKRSVILIKKVIRPTALLAVSDRRYL